MTESLIQAYLPLIGWTALGIGLCRFLPNALPRLLGRSLYWFGVPWEVLALARQTDLSQRIELVPIIAVAALGLGLGLSWLALQVVLHRKADLTEPLSRAQQGSFLIAATIGNTGFVGLGLVPTLISEANLGWAVFYSVTHNVVGTYGLGVLIASYFGRSQTQNGWWVQLRDVLTVPSLWAFIVGSTTRSLELPVLAEQALHASLWFVIPGAFLLMGMRLSQLHGWSSIRLAIFPSLLKVFVLPVLVGIGTTFVGLTGEPRLALVLMAGMPSAFAGLILAEEYELDRDLIASNIAVTTVALLATIPLWLVAFRLS
jgi:hypothetical protein